MKISSLLVEFSIPALIGLIVQALYNIVDAVYVGHGVGELGIAATTVSFPTMMAMVAVSMLACIGGNSLAAIKLGEKNKPEAERIMAHTLLLLVGVYAVFAICSTLFLDQLLVFSGATQEVLPYAHDFLMIILWAGFFQTISYGMNNFIRTAGNPRRALYTQLLGIGLNIVLGYLFVLQFKWGIRGAACATALSYFISATYVMSFFTSGTSPLKLSVANMPVGPRMAARILSLGVPAAAMQMGVAIINVIENNLINIYGLSDAVLGVDGGLAAMGVLSRIGYLIIVPAIGFSQGAQPIIGFNYGARQYDRIIETLKKAIIISTLLMTVVWITVMLFPVQYVRIFNLPVEFQTYTAHSLILYLLVVPIIGLQIVGSNYFQATGQALKATLLTLTRQIIFLIPLLYFTPRIAPMIIDITPLKGIFFASSISDLLATVTVAILLVFEIRRLKKQQKQLLAA